VTCAHAVGGALKKMKGVDKVEVKLNAGLAIVHLKSGNRISLQDMKKVISDHGFTPGDAVVKFTGTVNSENGKTWIEVSDVNEVLNLNEAAANSVSSQIGKTVVLQGKVTAPEKKSKTLELTELHNL
jgi:copper chaperone CopZ